MAKYLSNSLNFKLTNKSLLKMLLALMQKSDFVFTERNFSR